MFLFVTYVTSSILVGKLRIIRGGESPVALNMIAQVLINGEREILYDEFRIFISKFNFKFNFEEAKLTNALYIV